MLAAVLVHAASRMAFGLIVAIQQIVLLMESEVTIAGGQRGILGERAALAAVGGELVNVQAHRLAFVTCIALRAIGENPAAAKAGAHQFAVDAAVYHADRRRDLRACDAARKVRAAIGCRGVELQQREKWQVAWVGHGCPLKWPLIASAGHRPGGPSASVNTSSAAINLSRGMERAPSDVRWEVSIWQSIMPNSRRLR